MTEVTASAPDRVSVEQDAALAGRLVRDAGRLAASMRQRGIGGDGGLRIATKTNITDVVSDADHAVMEQWGAWGEKKLYGKVVTGVIRSTVVVDPSGVVQLAQYNVKATGHVAKLRRDLGIDAA